MRTVRAAAALLIVGFGAAGALLFPACGTSRRPNVLVVLWDTTRADHLSLYGYGRPTTPRLDAFAREATVYERATSRGTWTLPSHAAMFTGLAETTHGAMAHNMWLDNRHETLAERLRGVGYDTFAFTANIIVSPENNVLQGFDIVESSYPRPSAPRGRYLKPSRVATRRKLVPRDASNELGPAFVGSSGETWDKAVFKDSAPVAHRALTDFIDERLASAADRPWLAYLNLMEAHSPRVPSMAARRAVIGDESLIELGLTTDASVAGLMTWVVGKRTLEAEQIRAIEAVYDASLRDLDDATGDLFDDLRARGVLDDTVVVVVSDHGELLGQHGMFEHRYAMWDDLLHVPLVIRYPRAFPAGKRVQERVTTADLFSTVIELAGLPPVEGVASTSLVGRSTFEPFVVAQMLDPFSFMMSRMHELYPDVDMRPYTRTYCAAWQGDWKLIYASDDDHHLFDTATDPGELVDRYASETAKASELEAGLAAWESRLVVHDPELRDEQDRRMVRKHEARQSGGAPEGPDAEMLKQLGYAGSGDLGVPQLYPSFCGPRARQ